VAERPAEGPPGAEAAGGGAAEEEPSGGAASAGAPVGTVTEYGGGAGPGTGRTSDDAWLLAELHARLRQAAVRCAPAAVRRFGARGEVQLEFCLGPAGGVERVVVQRSSGVAVLDEAATTCVVPGAVPFPAAASGRCFTVPVQF
jgi:TonB family protein